ncbi:protein phosphatase [Youhaiella tibetensis]|uniref:Dual specificity protein phosphatase family protein n=1 Tax=Paradevosia tibetensis TaxID=1447062 RepID=A0A5B9DKY0_9HYPH|nr:dual specificity protein phosphatase [Youhaiella tibetensis]QEE19575.1 dual specificity protein phosphatase family protein [Youhaiella tibetensis]GGF31866.1 protein phosphatase [Youhaiella tibetensis]
MDATAPRYERPPISLIESDIHPYGISLFVGGMEGASDLELLKANGVTTVINCAVNLDFNYVSDPLSPQGQPVDYGYGDIRYYKLGLIDGPGNPETMFVAGYYLLRGALDQVLPERHTYPRRERGNVLVNCRGGRSRSVALTALFLHLTLPDRYPRLEDALDHVRSQRQLRRDEWFETPKPMLVEAVRRAAGWIRMIESDRTGTAPLQAAV